MQVTIIGGGSYQWGPKLIIDLLDTASLAGMDLVLCDIDAEPLPKIEAFTRLAAEQMQTKATVRTTTDQHDALDGADFVVVTISTGAFQSMAVDLDVPQAHGIRQSVGDTVGPGGINRSLRNIPVLVGIAHDMEKHCPDAWMLNITNPMTCLTRSVNRESSVRCVGLCHEVGNFAMDVAIAMGLPHTSIRPVVTGVNHFPVVTSLEIEGTDGFARIAELVEELGGLEEIRNQDQGEAEPFSRLDFAQRHQLALTFLDRFGAIPAAGDRHLAEFVPWVLTEDSGWGKEWGIDLTPISRREEHQIEYIAEVDEVLDGKRELPAWQSGEMVAPVIDSLLTGTTRELPLNMPNSGQCPDLPADAVVEAMCTVDGDGIRGRDAARAPAPLAELLRRHVSVQEMTVEAGVRGDRKLVTAAMTLDPLAGRGSLKETEEMVDELLAGTSRWLPRFSTEKEGAR